MGRSQGMTRGELLVVVGVLLLLVLVLAAILIPTRGTGSVLIDRTVCMSNLASMGKAITLYMGSNDNRCPWIPNVTSDWSAVPTGTNRAKNPFAAQDHPGDRAITSLMFLLVRENQPAKLFVCPSTDDRKDDNIRDDANAREDEEPEYFWDFSHSWNVSYSWQAPVWNGSACVSGLSGEWPDAVVMADQTPAVAGPPWDNTAWDPHLKGEQVRPHMSQNHSRKHVNVLCLGMDVFRAERPDIGDDNDMIYTASGKADGGSASATSLKLIDHLSARDTFLIGPVPREGDEPPTPERDGAPRDGPSAP
jgi:hypothetical protein